MIMLCMIAVICLQSVVVSCCCVHRTNWSYWRGNGPDQPRHARCWEEPARHGEMLRTLCPAMETVRCSELRYCCWWNCRNVALPWSLAVLSCDSCFFV